MSAHSGKVQREYLCQGLGSITKLSRIRRKLWFGYSLYLVGFVAIGREVADFLKERGCS